MPIHDFIAFLKSRSSAIEYLQNTFDEQFSLNGKVNPGEEFWLPALCHLFELDIGDIESRKNHFLADFIHPSVCYEFKQLTFDNPLSRCGKKISFTTSRMIHDVPRDVPVSEAISHICETYNRAVEKRRLECGGHAVLLVSLYSDTQVMIFNQPVPLLDADQLIGEWLTSPKGRTLSENKSLKSNGRKNLYVSNKETGEHIFTYLTNGDKFELSITVPEVNDVLIFNANRTFVSPRISLTLSALAEEIAELPIEKVIVSLLSHYISTHTNRLVEKGLLYSSLNCRNY